MSYGLTPDEQEQWDRDGYVVRERVFDRDDCEALAAVAGELATGRAAARHARKNALVAAGKVADTGGVETMHSAIMPHTASDLFRRRVRDPRLTDVVADLIGPDLVVHNSLFIFKSPGIGLPFPWHQDLWYFRKRFETETTIGTWQAIDDAAVSNGCLWVIPGSHLGEILEHDELEGDQQQEFKRARVPADETGIPVEVPAGSVLFFHSRLLHRSEHNRSDRWRRTYVCHYLSAHAKDKNPGAAGRPVMWVRGGEPTGGITITPDDQLTDWQGDRGG